VEVNLSSAFLLFVYICIVGLGLFQLYHGDSFFLDLYCCWRSNYQKGVGIQFTRLIAPHFYACPKPEPGFPMPYIVVFFLCVQ